MGSNIRGRGRGIRGMNPRGRGRGERGRGRGVREEFREETSPEKPLSDEDDDGFSMANFRNPVDKLR
jgi:hypothetical protein